MWCSPPHLKGLEGVGEGLHPDEEGGHDDGRGVVGAVVAAGQQINYVIYIKDGRMGYYRMVRKLTVSIVVFLKASVTFVCLRVEGIPLLSSISSYLSTNISFLFSVWAPIGLDRSRNVAGLDRSRVF